MEIPVGFRFLPNDEELVTYYLKNKVTLPPCSMIVERDIYSQKSPWNVFSVDDPWTETVPGENSKLSLYVFTTLKFLGKKTDQKQIARTAGYGSWHGETAPQDIFDRVTGAVIGKKTMFTYVSRDQTLKGEKGHWYMQEYALAGSSLEANQGTPSSVNRVLCKITRDYRKLLKVTAPPRQTKKIRGHVSGKEGVELPITLKEIPHDEYVSNTMSVSSQFLDENYSTTPQPGQKNANSNIIDGFSEELEKMLMEEPQGFDFVRALEPFFISNDDQEYQETAHDPNLEHVSKRPRYDLTIY